MEEILVLGQIGQQVVTWRRLHSANPYKLLTQELELRASGWRQELEAAKNTSCITWALPGNCRRWSRQFLHQSNRPGSLVEQQELVASTAARVLLEYELDVTATVQRNRLILIISALKLF